MDYHVLRSSNNGDHVNVIVHVPVPVEDNLAGKSLPVCVVEDPEELLVTQLPGGHLSTGEDVSLANGTLVEYPFIFSMNDDKPAGQRKTALEDRVTVIRDVAGPRVLRKRYWAWGFEGSGS